MSNELIVIEESKALAVFSNENGLDPIIQQAKDLVDGFEHDLSTGAGRKRTASLANKVAKLKTRLDGMGKDLVSDWKAQAKKVDANRKAMRDELDELKVIARKPLTEWEEEQARIEEEKRIAEEAEKLRVQMENDHEVALLMNEKFDRELAERLAEEKRIEEERQAKLEKERLEREALIAQQAKEQAEREASEREAKAKIEAQELAEKVERERLASIEREEQARRDAIAAEERAKAQAEEAERQRVIAEEKAKRDAEEAAERAKQLEIQRQKDEQERLQREQEAREANKRHIGGIHKAAKESLMELGMEEEQAKAVVMAIHNGQIANVKINY